MINAAEEKEQSVLVHGVTMFSVNEHITVDDDKPCKGESDTACTRRKAASTAFRLVCVTPRSTFVAKVWLTHESTCGVVASTLLSVYCSLDLS